MRRRKAESGQVSVLILGMVMLAMLLIVGGVDVTAAQLARVRLVDAADAAWGIAPGTGAQGGDTAVVVLDAIVELPMTGGLLAALGKEIAVHVEAKARAPLLPVP